MTEPERVIQFLLEIETETAAFYEGLARRPGEPPELRALWLSLAEEERQHASWVRRLQGSRLAEVVLASLSAPPMLPLEAALQEIRRQREQIERGSGSSVDALATAIALETSEASRALADLVAAVPHERDPGPFFPASAAHLGQLALAAERLGVPELAATARGLVPRLEPGKAGRRTVLIVDDDPDMLGTCARILQQGGYDCLTATGGREALDLLRSRRLDLILADLRMPEMDGLTLLANARQLAPGVPTVIVTAYASTDSARRAREAGAAAYLAKPFGVGELRDVVARVLGCPPGRGEVPGPPGHPGPAGPSVRRT
jgi:CheY-like chemotaxis protein